MTICHIRPFQSATVSLQSTNCDHNRSHLLFHCHDCHTLQIDFPLVIPLATPVLLPSSSFSSDQQIIANNITLFTINSPSFLRNAINQSTPTPEKVCVCVCSSTRKDNPYHGSRLQLIQHRSVAFVVTHRQHDAGFRSVYFVQPMTNCRNFQLLTINFTTLPQNDTTSTKKIREALLA